MLVAGFQGVSTAKDVTTLGRGGSDTTAVALAAAVGAEVCEIYTDVDGVFTADPRIVPDARKLPMVTFEEMLEMAASGAGVLQLRSVEYARNHGVRIHCRSSFHDRPGTVVVGEDVTVEQPLITAVTHSTGEARVTLLGVPDHPGIAGRIFGVLADANVNVDMIIQNEPVGEGTRAEVSFTVPRDDLRTARAALEPLIAEVGIEELTADETMGKVSIVGAGMKSHPGVAAKVFAHARRGGHQHRHDLHHPHQDLVRRRRATSRQAGRAAAARRVRAVRPGHDPARAAVRGVRGMRVAVAGATGAVGSIMLDVLRRRGFPADEVVPFASERSEGRTLENADAPVQRHVRGDDPGLRPRAVQRGRRHVARVGAAVRRRPARSSSTTRRAWRMHDDVPLVVTEVNADALAVAPGHRREPELHDDGRDAAAQGAARRVRPDARWWRRATRPPAARGRRASTSSPSRSARSSEDIDLLVNDGDAARRKVQSSVHADTLAFNVVPMLGTLVGDEGYTDEELKLQNESRKILALPDARRLAAVRARAGDGRPRDRGARDVRARARPRRGQRGARGVPEPRRPGGADAARVGRAATRSPSAACAADLADPNALNLFVVGDNLLKGAALNTVQIAEELHARDLVRPAAGAASA